MRNRAEETRAQLEAWWPGWKVWIVWRAVGGPLWCARRWDGSGQVLNEASTDGLAHYLKRPTAR